MSSTLVRSHKSSRADGRYDQYPQIPLYTKSMLLGASARSRTDTPRCFRRRFTNNTDLRWKRRWQTTLRTRQITSSPCSPDLLYGKIRLCHLSGRGWVRRILATFRTLGFTFCPGLMAIQIGDRPISVQEDQINRFIHHILAKLFTFRYHVIALSSCTCLQLPNG